MTAPWDIGMYTFPWALADEGPDRVLDLIQRRAGCTTVVVAAHYHTAKFLHPRPHPHFYFTDAATAYFRPSPKLYSRTAIKPVVSKLTQSRDVLAETAELARSRGMRFHAWLVCLHSTILGTRHPECLVRNAFGDPLPFALSPSHPDVQEYVCAVVGDVASTLEPDRIELESIEYVPTAHGYHHELDGVPLDEWHRLLLGLDFSPAAMRDAQQRGVNLGRAKETVRRLLEGYFADPADAFNAFGARPSPPEIEELLAVRREILADLVARISRSTAIPVDVILSPWNRRVATFDLEGHDPALLGARAGRLLLPLYSADPAEVEAELLALRGQLGSLAAVTPVVYLLHEHTPDRGVLEAICEIICASGIRRCHFYNHAFLATPTFEWITDALSRLPVQE